MLFSCRWVEWSVTIVRRSKSAEPIKKTAFINRRPKPFLWPLSVLKQTVYTSTDMATIDEAERCAHKNSCTI